MFMFRSSHRTSANRFVLTGAPHGDSYSYGYGYDQRVYDARGEAEQPRERT